MTPAILGLLNIGGAELILILGLMLILVAVPAVVIGIALFMTRKTPETSTPASPASPPPIPGSKV